MLQRTSKLEGPRTKHPAVLAPIIENDSLLNRLPDAKYIPKKPLTPATGRGRLAPETTVAKLKAFCGRGTSKQLRAVLEAEKELERIKNPKR